MKEFNNKVAVITGAASGIGRGIANRCVKAGMKVVLADIEEKALFQAEKELKASGASVLSMVTDVSKAENIEFLAKKTINTFGEVHLLCNNAGVTVPGAMWEYSLSDWKWVIDVNLWGVIHGIRIFVPIMLKQGNECHIVNTSSLAGIISGDPGQSIYSVTKHGVVALSEALSSELKSINSKIKVSVLCPGFVNTNIMDCERNRQTEYCDLGFEPTLEKLIKKYPIVKANINTGRQTLKAGLSPDKVGDIVFQAIQDEILYILTDTRLTYKKGVQNRMNGILKAFEQNKIYMQ